MSKSLINHQILTFSIRFLLLSCAVRFGGSFVIEKNRPFTLYTRNQGFPKIGGVWDGLQLKINCQGKGTGRFIFAGCSSLEECRSVAQQCFPNDQTVTNCTTYKLGLRCAASTRENYCSEIEIPVELPWEEGEESEYLGDAAKFSNGGRYFCEEDSGKNVSLDVFAFSGMGGEGRGHLHVPQVFIQINHNGSEISNLVTDQKQTTLRLYTDDPISISCRFNSHLFQHPNPNSRSILEGILANGTIFEIDAQNATATALSDEWGFGYYIYNIPRFFAPKNLSEIKCSPTSATSATMTPAVFKNILVRDPQAAPAVIENATTSFRLNETRELSCRYKGEPEPLILWLQNDKVLDHPTLGKREQDIFESVLQLTPNLTQNGDESSTYTCAVVNRLGRATKLFVPVLAVLTSTDKTGTTEKTDKMDKTDKTSSDKTSSAGGIKLKEASSSSVLVNIVACAVILILISVLVVLWWKYRKLREEHVRETIDNVVLQPMLSNRQS